MEMNGLESVLSYQNPEVIARFMRETGLDASDADEIFTEMKRWLWLCGTSPDAPVNMVGEAFVIDEMWHTFLLFTRDYADFCERFFGRFIHHMPKTSEQRSDPDWRVGLKRDYELIYDRLGPATLIKWCHEFPKRYAQRRGRL